MSINRSVWLVACVIVLAVAGSFVFRQKQPALQAAVPASAAETEFIRQGVILQEYCRQGVSFRTFSDQLVQVSAAGRLAESEICRRDAVRWAIFCEAQEAWEVAQAVWRREIGGVDYIRASDPRLNEILAKLGEPNLSSGAAVPVGYAWDDPLLYLPPLIGESKPARPAVESARASTTKLTRLGMARGSAKFQEAMDFRGVEAEVEKIKALRAGGKK